MPSDPVSTAADISYRGQYRIAKVPPGFITRNDLRKLYTNLDARTSEAHEKHIATIVRPPTVEEQPSNPTLKDLTKEAWLNTTVQGRDVSQIGAGSAEP